MTCKVAIIESEAGWGQRIDEVIEFDHPLAAETFCRIYNRRHNPPMSRAPDWYMYARMSDQPPGTGMIR